MPLNGERQLLRDREARAEGQAQEVGEREQPYKNVERLVFGAKLNVGERRPSIQAQGQETSRPRGRSKGFTFTSFSCGQAHLLGMSISGVKTTPPCGEYFMRIAVCLCRAASATDQAARHKLQCVPELPHGMHRERCIIQDQNHTSQDIRLGA